MAETAAETPEPSPEPAAGPVGYGGTGAIHYQAGGEGLGAGAAVTISDGSGTVTGSGGGSGGQGLPESMPAPAEPDHKGLLHELAGHIRTVAASGKKDVTELLAWLASKGL